MNEPSSNPEQFDRDLFERTMRGHWQMATRRTFRRDPHGDYEHDVTRGAWMGWKAALLEIERIDSEIDLPSSKEIRDRLDEMDRKILAISKESP